MRLRLRFVVIVFLLFIGIIFLFNGLNTGGNHGSHAKTDYRLEKDRETAFITPNSHIIDAETTPSALAVNDSQRIVYNRVPKCGSRSVVSLFKTFAVVNKFRVIEPASNYPYQLRPQDQQRISDLISALKPPFMYHRHLHYIDFAKFSGPSVVYINLIRDPIARAVSHFYFRRYGDRRLNQTRAKKPIKNEIMTYDECVLKEHKECMGHWGTFFIVPFFCGHSKECREESKWALKQAMKNVAKYLVVGILEEYDDFVKVLETLLPGFFQGAYKQSKTRDPSSLPKLLMSETRRKQKPSEKVIAIARKHMKLEYEFYDFIKERFHKLKKSLNIQ